MRRALDPPNWLNGLSDPFGRRPTGPASSDVLGEWGVVLEADEAIRFWLLGDIATGSGYLVVTDRRFFLFGQDGPKTYRALHQAPLPSVTAVAALPGRGHGLRLAGEQYEVTVTALRDGEAEQVRDYIQEAVPR